MKNGLVGIAVVFLIIAGIFVYDNYFDNNDFNITTTIDSIAVIEHPPVITYELQEFRIAVDLEPRKVKAEIEEDTSGGKVYSYTDTYSYKSDSLEFSITATNKVRQVSMESSYFTWSDIVVKPLMKIVTERVDSIVYRTKTVEVQEPFYSDEWFWSTIAGFLLLLASLL